MSPKFSWMAENSATKTPSKFDGVDMALSHAKATQCWRDNRHGAEGTVSVILQHSDTVRHSVSSAGAGFRGFEAPKFGAVLSPNIVRFWAPGLGGAK